MLLQAFESTEHRNFKKHKKSIRAVDKNSGKS
jgi:hypothetical protein